METDKTSQCLSLRGIFVLMSPSIFLLLTKSREIVGSESRGAADISWVETECRNIRVMVRPIVDMTVSERSIERAEDPYCLRFFVWDQLEIGKESNWETKKRRKVRCQNYHEKDENFWNLALCKPEDALGPQHLKHGPRKSFNKDGFCPWRGWVLDGDGSTTS